MFYMAKSIGRAKAVTAGALSLLLMIKISELYKGYNMVNVESAKKRLSEKMEVYCTKKFVAEYLMKNDSTIIPHENYQEYPTVDDILWEPVFYEGTGPMLLCYVSSATDHVTHRRLIRSTWGSTRHFLGVNIRVIFVIGIKPDLNQTVLEAITEEIITQKDVLLVNVLDLYKHLTYKGTAALKWITQKTGPAVRYIIKTDDDMFVNTRGWVHFLVSRNLPRAPHDLQFMLGVQCWRNMSVTHNERRTFYVPLSEYNRSFFPPYCGGQGYLLSRGAVNSITRELRQYPQPLPRIEDAFFTGILGERLNISLTWLGNYHFVRYSSHLVGRVVLLIHGMPPGDTLVWKQTDQMVNAWYDLPIEKHARYNISNCLRGNCTVMH